MAGGGWWLVTGGGGCGGWWWLVVAVMAGVLVVAVVHRSQIGQRSRIGWQADPEVRNEMNEVPLHRVFAGPQV